MTCVTSNRLVSSSMVIHWLPNCVEATHDVDLTVGGATGGNYRLSINGAPTALIAYNALASAVESAINAVAGTGAFTVTGTSPNYNVTAAAVGYWEIEVYQDATTGGSAGNNVKVTVVTQGSTTYTISDEANAFSYEVSTETTDVTPLSQLEEQVLTTKETMTGSFTIFYSTEANVRRWRRSLRAGSNGTFTVYPQGVGSGLPMHRFKAMIESTSFDAPERDKVTLEVSFRRQGADIYRPDTLQV